MRKFFLTGSVSIVLLASFAHADESTIRFQTAKPFVAQAGKPDWAKGYTPGFAFDKDKSITLSGELLFPKGDGPFPAVVLAHGCSGVGYAGKAWAPLLREWGYATFAVDSFNPRGFKRVCEDGSRLLPLERTPDVYGALNVVSTHPKIDPNRIGLMGFSHGGIVTINSSTKWAKDKFAQNGQGYKAFIAVYPYCNVTIPELNSITTSLRIHTGELDDWTPAKPCEQHVNTLKASNQDAEISIYPNAHHAFDDPSEKLFYGAKLSSAAKCWWSADVLGGPMTITPASCWTNGATVGNNPAAMALARQNVRAELDQLLK